MSYKCYFLSESSQENHGGQHTHTLGLKMCYSSESKHHCYTLELTIPYPELTTATVDKKITVFI